MTDPAIVAAQIAVIQERYPEWHASPEALAEASALWGGCNDHGVFPGRYEEVAGRGKCSASVTIAQAPNGLFTCGCRYHSPDAGFGHQPRAWDPPFATRKEARKAA